MVVCNVISVGASPPSWRFSTCESFSLDLSRCRKALLATQGLGTHSGLRTQAWAHAGPACLKSTSGRDFATCCVTSGSFESNVGEELPERDDNAWLLETVQSTYSSLSVVEIDVNADHELAGARVLYFNDMDLVQSVYWTGKVWTGSYYDEFASLPPLLPEGPVAILGLGAGTGARILQHAWPRLRVEGWELDSEVIRLARRYFGLRDLEKTKGRRSLKQRRKARIGRRKDENELESGCDECPSAAAVSALSDGTVGQVSTSGIYARKEMNTQGIFQANRRTSSLDSTEVEKVAGELTVHVGDALQLGLLDTENDKFAGLIVDLSNGTSILPALQDSDTWQSMKKCLKSDGRILINCGSLLDERDCGKLGLEVDEVHKEVEKAINRVVAAVGQVFEFEVCRRELPDNGRNVLLMTGPCPDLSAWAQAVPAEIRCGITDWHCVSYTQTRV